jgi:hypothetical protein
MHPGSFSPNKQDDADEPAEGSEAMKKAAEIPYRSATATKTVAAG